MGEMSRAKKKEVNPKWFRHEALHTTHVLLSTLDSHLANHWYYQQKINPEFNKHIEAALEHLASAYQAVGNEENEVKKKIKMQTF